MTLADLGRWLSGLWTCRQLRQAMAGHAEAVERLQRALDERRCGGAVETAAAAPGELRQPYGRRKDDFKP